MLRYVSQFIRCEVNFVLFVAAVCGALAAFV
jgi:hypothetical protein